MSFLEENIEMKDSSFLSTDKAREPETSLTGTLCPFTAIAKQKGERLLNLSFSFPSLHHISCLYLMSVLYMKEDRE
jgi:hypothetical protein